MSGADHTKVHHAGDVNNGQAVMLAAKRVRAGDEPSQLPRAVETYLAELETGRHLDREEFIARYPEIADELRKCLDGLELIHRAGHQLSSVGQSSSSADGHPATVNATLGDFRILREIGRGGMGVVYEAEQISLPRRVALKVLPFAGVLDSRQLERFKTEARAAATLDHPGIVSIYSVGCERAVHFYAMQYIEGQTVAQLIKGLRQLKGVDQPVEKERSGTVSQVTRDLASGYFAPANPRAGGDDAITLHPKNQLHETLHAQETPPVPHAAMSTERSTENPKYFRTVAGLGIQAAEALDHAHANGVLHRDIKPGNLMLDAKGKLWITDFGLARIEANPGMTMTGDILGTLRYMSPEQAMAKRVLVDQRADIYSIGITLYEMLTLEPAFQGDDREELLKQIAFEEPCPLCRINKAIPRDLETIVHKAMGKNPEERYATAQELADDLKHFLNFEPIQAKRPTVAMHMTKWARRHRALVLALAVVLMVALVASTVSTAMIAGALGQARIALAETEVERNNANIARGHAEQERDAAYQNLYISQMRLAQRDWESGLSSRLSDLLDNHLPQPGHRDLRGWEWYFFNSARQESLLTLDSRHEVVLAIDWRPNGRQFASAGRGGTVNIWDANTGQEVRTLHVDSDTIYDVAWSQDGVYLATAEIGKLTTSGYSKTINIWEAETGREVHSLRDNSDASNFRVCEVTWSPDGSHIASADYGKTIKVWQVDTEQIVRTLTCPNTAFPVAWSPDGRRLASSGQGGWLWLWDTTTGEVVARNDSLKEEVFCVSWSPDGKRLATASYSGGISTWDSQTGERLVELAGHKGSCEQVAWSPDGRRLASASRDESIKVWESDSGELEQTIYGHNDWVLAVAWSPDGKRLVTGARDGTLKVWRADIELADTVLLEHAGVIDAIAWKSDGSRLASLSRAGTLKVWDASTRHNVLTIADDSFLFKGTNELAHSLVWSSDDEFLATATFSGPIKVWNANNGKEVISIGHDVKCVAWSPDDNYLVSGGTEGKGTMYEGTMIHLWHATTGKEVRTMQGHTQRIEALAWSHRGNLLASGAWDGTVRIWEPNTGQVIVTLKGHRPERWIRSLSWRYDDKYVASASWDQTVKVWDVAAGSDVATLKGHVGVVECVAWSPDGKRIATASWDETIKIWDSMSGREIVTFANHPGKHRSIAWSPDGQKLAAGSTNGTIMIWDASRGYETAALSHVDPKRDPN